MKVNRLEVEQRELLQFEVRWSRLVERMTDGDHVPVTQLSISIK